MGGGKGVMKDMIKIIIYMKKYITTELIMFQYMLIVKFLKKKNSPSPKGRKHWGLTSEEQCLVLTQMNQGG